MTYNELYDRLDIAIDMLGIAIDKGQPTEAARARVAEARAALDAFNAGETNALDKADCSERADGDPAQIKLPPLQAVTRTRWECVMIVVPGIT